MDEQYCAHCGGRIEENSAVCRTCGAAFVPTAARTPLSAAEQPTPASVPVTDTPAAIPVVEQPAPSTPAAAAPSQSGTAAYPMYPGYTYGYPYPYGWQGYSASAPGAIGSGAGYPAYAQGTPSTPAAPTAPAYPSNGYAGYPFAYPYGYPYPYYGSYAYPIPYPQPMYWRPRRAPGETHALVVSWIVTVAGGLSILCGLLMAFLFALIIVSNEANSLSVDAVFTGGTVGPLVGGAFAIYYGVRGILRRPSPRFSLPNPWLFVGLTALLLAAGVVFWHMHPAPGAPGAVLPLAIASGVLPAFGILSFTAWRLRLPSTRRHVWMSYFYGLTLAPLLAIILEIIAGIVIAAAARAFGFDGSSAIADPSTINPNNSVEVIILLLTLSVAAPVVEEGVKPLGAVLLMRRLRTPASAFLMGMAAGIGFDMFETIGYIGSGEADWIGVAIERIGAGLLHGVGAGMAALGWYYLINGKGVRLRWLRGFGGILYAMIQHAIFNGSNLLGLVPGPVGRAMQAPLYIGRLPLDGGIWLFFVFYALIFGVLVYVTGRLARQRPRGPSGALETLETPQPAFDASGSVGQTPVGSGAR